VEHKRWQRNNPELSSAMSLFLLLRASVCPKNVSHYRHAVPFLARPLGEYKCLLQHQFLTLAHAPHVVRLQKVRCRTRMCAVRSLRPKSSVRRSMFGVTFLQKRHVGKQQKMLFMSEGKDRVRNTDMTTAEKESVSLTCCGTIK